MAISTDQRRQRLGPRLLSTIADAVFIMTCCVLVGLLGYRYWSAAKPPPSGKAAEDFIKVGELFQDHSITYDEDRLALVFLASRCRFCNASVPFYQLLENEGRRTKRYGLRFVAAEPRAQFDAYARANGLGDVKVEYRSTFIGIPGTPSLVVLGRDRRVLGSWLGRLNPDQEERVRRALGLTGRPDAPLPSGGSQ